MLSGGRFVKARAAAGGRTVATIVEVSREGRVTLPASVRKALRLDEGDQLAVEVREGAIVLTPVVTIPREDAWAYTADHRAQVAQALQEIAEGRVYRGLGPDDLRRLAPVDERADAAEAEHPPSQNGP